MARMQAIPFLYKGFVGSIDIREGQPTMVSWVNAYVQIDACCAKMRAVVDRAIAGEPMPLSGVCRQCGCTDQDCMECVLVTGQPCFWTDADHTLCSRCTVNDPTAHNPIPTYELGLTQDRKQLVISRVDGAALSPDELTSFFDAWHLVVNDG